MEGKERKGARSHRRAHKRAHAWTLERSLRIRLIHWLRWLGRVARSVRGTKRAMISISANKQCRRYGHLLRGRVLVTQLGFSRPHGASSQSNALCHPTTASPISQ